jgi:type VI protein secretion system component VasK
MTETQAWQRELEPPPGGLQRLMHSVERRRAPRTRLLRRHAFAGAAAAVLVLVAGMQLSRAPRRAFEHALQTAIEETDTVHERGIAHDLPSARADVRIVVLDAAGAAAGERP